MLFICISPKQGISCRFQEPQHDLIPPAQPLSKSLTATLIPLLSKVFQAFAFNKTVYSKLLHMLQS